MMKLYDNYSTYFLLIFLIVMHILTLGLCTFFYIHFLVESYDPGAYFLIGMFLLLLLFLDICCMKGRLLFRLLIRCKFDDNGIFCYGFCIKSWNMPWDKICTYGITGYSTPNQPYGIIFLSLDSNELYDKAKIVVVNHQRIVFQVRDEIWPELSKFMPDDMKKQLRYSIDSKRDCFCKRKVVK